MRLMARRTKRWLCTGLIFCTILGTVACHEVVQPAPPSQPEPSSVPQQVSSAPPQISTDESEHESLASLYAKNNQTVGWIQIDGTKTDNVVMQNKEDNFYWLDRKFDGRRADSGELYIDYRCRMEADYLSQNITIYGHHMINGTMFGQIKRYSDLSFYREHPTFRFDSLYENYTWKVFAVFIVDRTKEENMAFDSLYRQPEFESAEAFADYIAEVRRRSLIVCPVDICEDDRIVCLSTCTYVSDDARLVVAARKVREGEDPSVQVELARKNT